MTRLVATRIFEAGLSEPVSEDSGIELGLQVEGSPLGQWFTMIAAFVLVAIGQALNLTDS